MQTRNDNRLVSSQNKRKLTKAKKAIGKKLASYYGNFTRLFSSGLKAQQQYFNILPAVTGANFERQDDAIMRSEFSLKDYINLGGTNKINYANFKRYLSVNKDLQRQIEFGRTTYKSMQYEIQFLRSRQMRENISLQMLMAFVTGPIITCIEFPKHYDGPFYPLMLFLAIVLVEFLVVLMTKQMFDFAMDEKKPAFLHQGTLEDREKINMKHQEFNEYYDRLRLFSRKTIAECTDDARKECVDGLSVFTPHAIK